VKPFADTMCSPVRVLEENPGEFYFYGSGLARKHGERIGLLRKGKPNWRKLIPSSPLR